MSSYVASSLKMNYGNSTVMMKHMELCENQKMNEQSAASKVEVTNLSVKYFHWMLKKNPAFSLQLFHAVIQGPMKK